MRGESEDNMTRANKEILRVYRKLNREFDSSMTYPDWVARRLKVLSKSDISLKNWRTLVNSVCR